ncbi:hypothetical protein [Celerinatantimonas sp. MCCC 1A17872]|uniref:hypothetical protein n=1 Tax=Celerinatantimonas sp. MCCC 1A17872 TaxID=3177514 RepID=UPI0038C4135A
MPKRNRKYKPGAKRYDIFREMMKCNYGGLLNEVTDMMLKNLFDSMDEAAQYFGVNKSTLHRWRTTGKWPVMALRLLLIMHRGYLPTSNDWARCVIRKERGTNPKREPIHLLYIPGFTTGFRPEDVRWHIMLKSHYERLVEAEKQALQAQKEAQERRGKFNVIQGGKLWKKID